MAFKLNNPPYSLDNTPVYHVPLEEGILGKADRNGSILINKDITDPKQEQDVIKHESVHVDQMKRGDLDYDDKYVYWKGKKYLRSKMKEGSPALAWEKEAYKKS
jgi:hypothetical protein